MIMDVAAFISKGMPDIKVLVMLYKDSPEPPPPGMLTDRFGVGWMVSVEAQPPQ